MVGLVYRKDWVAGVERFCEDPARFLCRVSNGYQRIGCLGDENASCAYGDELQITSDTNYAIEWE